MYDNLIDAIEHMNSDDAKEVLICLIKIIDNELHDCKEAPKHVDNLHDSVVFNDALCWVKDCVQQTVDFALWIKKDKEG